MTIIYTKYKSNHLTFKILLHIIIMFRVLQLYVVPNLKGG